MTISKIKVAYILTPITFGGAEKISLNFLRTVDRNRFEIKPVLLIRPWEKELYFAGELRHLGYNFETVPVALSTENDPMRTPRVAHQLYSYLKQGSFDLVHTHGYFADICGQTVARALRISSVSTCHGFIESDWKMKIYIRLDKYTLRLCKTVIAVSEGIKDDLVRSGILDSRITVIPNSVSLHCKDVLSQTLRQETRHTLSIMPDDLVIGYLGRLSKEKGVSYLVEAASGLMDTEAQLKFLIVGDGPERAALEQQVKDLGLADSFIFTGFRNDVEKLYPAFDMFILPSLTEGTPLALLESMAAGVPVIASAVGGVPNVVTDGVNGLLVPPGNSSAIKQKIQSLMSNSELSYGLKREGIKTIKVKYDIHEWCRTIETCYHKALPDHYFKI